MPIELGIWRIGTTLERVSFSSIESEQKLEDSLAQDIRILSPGLLLIGRQVATSYGKYVDLLAIDAEGDLIVIELKRDRTPREVVAQLIDYASWAQGLTYDGIAEIYLTKNGRPLEEAFAETFNTSPPEKLNQSHRLIVVASELDPGTERIINYLSTNYGVPINAVFFRYFRDGANEYLARTWLIDPANMDTASGKEERWNGRDYYVSFGESEHRSWEDARKYGFISGGQGKWYYQTLLQLEPGKRVFVMIPRVGYVGVGIVKGEAQQVSKFTVAVDGREAPILELPLNAPSMNDNADNPEMAEYLVPVEWIATVPRQRAYWEKGFFANQNTVCRLRNRFTLENLVRHFDLRE